MPARVVVGVETTASRGYFRRGVEDAVRTTYYAGMSEYVVHTREVFGTTTWPTPGTPGTPGTSEWSGLCCRSLSHRIHHHLAFRKRKEVWRTADDGRRTTEDGHRQFHEAVNSSSPRHMTCLDTRRSALVSVSAVFAHSACRKIATSARLTLTLPPLFLDHGHERRLADFGEELKIDRLTGHVSG